MNEELLCKILMSVIGAQALVGLCAVFVSRRRYRYSFVSLLLAMLMVAVPWLIFPMYLHWERRNMKLSENVGEMSLKASRYKVWLGWSIVGFLVLFSFLLMIVFGQITGYSQGQNIELAVMCSSLATLLYSFIVLVVIKRVENQTYFRYRQSDISFLMK